MTRAEWLDYFETVNGRAVSVQEMADARNAGEFIDEAPAKTEDVQLLLNPLLLRRNVETSTSPLPTSKRHQ